MPETTHPTISGECNIKWHGNTDSKTSVHTFDTGRNPQRMHDESFAAVSIFLHELAVSGNLTDVHGHHPVQIMCEVEHWSGGRMISYRFTSDRAYDEYRDELTSMGSCCGRGGFNPWQSGSTDYDEWLASKEEIEAKGKVLPQV